MMYSDYLIDQITSPIYEQVGQKLLSLAENEETRRKMNGILYEGGFDNFSINGEYAMEREVLFKNNPTIEAQKRLNMSYLLLTNPKMLEEMQQTGAVFFHGTNANALPSILKYGINSVDKSRENNIEVTTGEEWSRAQGKRNFVSVTDCLDVALNYAGINPNIENTQNSLLNFGIVVGVSFQNMADIKTTRVSSDIPEVGVIENLPLDHIKFLAVPKDKEEFVKKLIGQKNIEIVGMDLDDIFYNLDFHSKLEILESTKENSIPTRTTQNTFTKQEIKKVVQGRRISKIKEIFDNLKHIAHNRFEKNTYKNDIDERS